MKDAKGHGSDARGGPAAPAHQAGIEQATAPMQRRQYEAIAGAINSYPGADKADLANHFTSSLGGTNSQFQADKFRQAAMTGNMGRTKGADPGMQRRHYEAVASMIRSYGQSHPESRAAVAQHFAGRFGAGNPNFKPDRFTKATE